MSDCWSRQLSLYLKNGIDFFHTPEYNVTWWTGLVTSFQSSDHEALPMQAGSSVTLFCIWFNRRGYSCKKRFIPDFAEDAKDAVLSLCHRLWNDTELRWITLSDIPVQMLNSVGQCCAMRYNKRRQAMIRYLKFLGQQLGTTRCNYIVWVQ